MPRGGKHLWILLYRPDAEELAVVQRIDPAKDNIIGYGSEESVRPELIEQVFFAFFQAKFGQADPLFLLTEPAQHAPSLPRHIEFEHEQVKGRRAAAIALPFSRAAHLCGGPVKKSRTRWIKIKHLSGKGEEHGK